MNWLTGSKNDEARKLIRQLKDVSKRKQAAAELLKLGTEAVPAIVEAIQTEDQSLLPLYGQIIVRIGPTATPALTHSLLNDHPLIRGRIAEILAQTKDPGAVPALLTALRGEFYTVRAQAANALGAIGDQAAVEPLREALKDGEPDVRIAAVKALGKFKLPETFDNMADLLLEDSEIEVRQATVKALGGTEHPQTIPFLMLALRDPFWWYEREGAAQDLLETIESFGELVVDPLLEALNDSEGAVRRYAATMLGHIRDTRAKEPLGMILYDMHFEVGQAAAESLAGFGPPGLKLLAEALNHPETWLRQHAIFGLTLSGDKRIVPIILKMLKDPEREVQKQAIQALGELQDERALSALQAITTNRGDKEMYALAKQAIETIERGAKSSDDTGLIS